MRRLSPVSNSTPAIQLTQVGESMQRVMEVKERAEDFVGEPYTAGLSFLLARACRGESLR